eukprot:c9197_g1_i1.p1 GENE.c9197_g1_i1~~c9197_g1_i1.p1  ORF type:complete len:464 (+),score=95.93 c9197_g1_i1:66-1394(+)
MSDPSDDGSLSDDVADVHGHQRQHDVHQEVHDINEHHHLMHAAQQLQMSHHDPSGHQNAVMTAAQAAQAAAQAAPDHHIVHGQMHSQSSSHMQNQQRPKRVQTRRSWTPEEDKRLIELVNAEGGNCWSQIASHLEGRVGKQCRERWRNHLDPNIRRDIFTPEEDERILEFVQELGTRWSKIAQRLPGRTENAVKNRYHCFLKNRDANSGKRARDDKHSMLHKHKRSTSDKYPGLMYDPDLDNPKPSPEGNFTCNLMGCGKNYAQLSHLLAHRLTHFSDGRHPSLQSQSMPGAPATLAPVEQRDAGMVVRALDGLVDDLLSQVQPSQVKDMDGDKMKDHHHQHLHHHHMHHHDDSMLHNQMLHAHHLHHLPQYDLHMHHHMSPMIHHQHHLVGAELMSSPVHDPNDMKALHDHHHHLLQHQHHQQYHTVDDGSQVKLEDLKPN